jgi:prephenate dehydrogenase
MVWSLPNHKAHEVMVEAMKVMEHQKDPAVPQLKRSADRHWGAGSRVGVIGGMGEMGRLFTRFFQDSSYQVEVADLGSKRSNREVLEEADIVLFAVPLHETVAVIRELIPYVQPHQLLMDVTSLKVAPVKAMLESPAAVVGLHPMFGGRVASLQGQTLVACPVRIAAPQWIPLKQTFIDAGMRVKECTPEEHDRMMSVIQVLFHMTTMLMGRVLRDLGVDIDATLEYTSPSYRLEMSQLGRMFAQSAELYAAITQMNVNTGEILALLRNGLDAYEGWYRTQDFQAFVADFERSALHLGGFCDQAYRESSEILDFVVRLGQPPR